MTMWNEYVGGGASDADLFDPLCVQRSAPISDEEAEAIEAMCLATTPGPLVIDDETEGDGSIVATLPNGRMIVSMTARVEQTDAPDVNDANAHLICQARYLVLRLLRDRRCSQQERTELLTRIGQLEQQLEQHAEKESLCSTDSPWVVGYPR